MTRALATAALLLLVLAPSPAAGQRPGELRGRVTDRLTGEPVGDALIDFPALGLSARAASDGSYAITGIEAGRQEVRTSAVAYLEHRTEVCIGNGRIERLDIQLAPQVVELDRIRAQSPAGLRSVRLDLAQIRESGASTAGEILEGVPGVVVHRRGGSGPATVSIRGGDPGHVLVLLDGMALNDPVTGAADVSTVSLATVESITVQHGAQTARYGPGAMAGVVVIESSRPEPRLRLQATRGSLGERRGAAALGTTLGDWRIDLSGRAEQVDGGFDYRIPAEAGGGTSTRSNADLSGMGGLLTAEAELAGGTFRALTGGDRMRRGLPGRGHAPSPEARQALDRARLGADWRRAGSVWSPEVRLQLVEQRVAHRDPAPPGGLAYDDTAQLSELRGEIMMGHAGAPGRVGDRLERWTAGLQLSRQVVEADALDPEAPTTRVRAGAFMRGESTAQLGPAVLSGSLTGRLDHDGVDGTRPTYAATARVDLGLVTVHGRALSSYAPPTLGDHFFREGVAVEPNPGLRAERVPLELELGIAGRHRLGPTDAEASLTIFSGDVRDMIVWAPDFRFVWRPTNVDVRRWGGEASAQLQLPAQLRATGSFALASVTYDSPRANGAQVAYRPRHSGRIGLDWRPGQWRAALTADYTGERYPSAARVNRLPPFWQTRLSAGRPWRLGDWHGDVALHVDRILDEKQSLIFGFPEPGRTFHLRVDLERRLTR